MLEKLGVKHALIVMGEGDDRLFSAPRAIWRRIRFSRAAGLNVYDLLNYDELLMTEATARAIEARLAAASKGKFAKDSDDSKRRRLEVTRDEPRKS